jgi:hypothetical protein
MQELWAKHEEVQPEEAGRKEVLRQLRSPILTTHLHTNHIAIALQAKPPK